MVALDLEIKDFLAEDGPGWAVFRQEVPAGGNAGSTSTSRELPQPGGLVNQPDEAPDQAV